MIKLIFANSPITTYPKYSYDDEKYDLEEVPIAVIGNLEKYQLARSERVHSLEQVG